MGKHRPMLLTGAVWELLRFGVLFSLFYVSFHDTRLSMVRVVWFGGPGLALGAAYVYAAFGTTRRDDDPATEPILRIISIGKLLGILPAVVLVVLNVPAYRIAFSAVATADTVYQLAAPALVLLVDFLFFLFLVTSATGGEPESDPEPLKEPENPLPEHRETRIEDR